MLNKDQLDSLRKANKTISIVGKFRNYDDPDESREYTFSNNSTSKKRLNELEFFHHVKPELRCVANQILTIGKIQFNAFDLLSPLQAQGKETRSLPLDIESPMLENLGNMPTDVKQVQEQGGKLFAKLLKNLDIVAPFTHSNFGKSLLKFAQEYLCRYANKVILADSNVQIDQLNWYSMYNSSHELQTAVIKYLTCYRKDEVGIHAHFRQVLQSLAKENTDWKPEYTNAIAEALLESKIALQRPDTDIILQVISKEEGMEWFNDYPGNLEYYVSGAKPTHKNFYHFYQTYLNASNEIHKFLRNGPQHSLLFCWLASKYQGYDSGASLRNVSKKLYDITVEGQGDKRIPCESRKDWKETVATLQKTESGIEEPASEDYQFHKERTTEILIESLQPKRCFTRNQLVKRCTQLFVRLSQLCGGTIAGFHKETTAYASIYNKFYNIILNTKEPDEDDDDEYNMTYYRKRLLKACTDQEQKDFITSFTDELLAQEKRDAAPINDKETVKKAYLKAYAQKGKSKFAKNWKENEDKIEEEKQEALRAYQIRIGQDVNAEGRYNTENDYGISGLAVPIKEIPDIQKEELDAKQKSMRKKMEQVALYHSPKREIKLKTSVPESIAKLTTDTLSWKKDGKELANSTKDQDGLHIVTTLEQGEEILDNDELQVEGANEEKDLVSLEHIPELKQTIEAVRDSVIKKEEIKSSIKCYYDSLTNYQNKIAHAYNRNDEKQVQQMLRSLIIGEYMLSTKDTNLDTDDLSNILGIIIDMIEHIGDLSLGEKLFSNTPIEGLEDKLAKINLSQYYPIENMKDLAKILQYHMTVAARLNNVKSYLEQVKELKNFFSSVKGSSGLDINFVNESIIEHLKNPWETCVLSRTPGSFLYLTGENGTKDDIEDNLQNRLTHGINQLVQGLAGFQLPVFTSYNNFFQSQCVPAVTVNLPNFGTIEKECVFRGKTTKILEACNLETVPVLAFCASVLGAGNFGKFVGVIKEDEQHMFDVKPDIREGEKAVVKYFQELIQHEQYNEILSNLIFVRWFNIALQARFNPDNSANIVTSKNFGNFLDQIYKAENLKVWQAAFQNILNFTSGKEGEMLPLIQSGNVAQNIDNTGGVPLSITENYGAKYKDVNNNWEEFPPFSKTDWKIFYNGKF